MSASGERRVAVTGLGLMTGLGLDVASTWRGLMAGRRTGARFRLFPPEGLKTTFGVELPDGADDLFAQLIKPRSRTQMTRGTRIAVATAHQALADAGLDPAGGDGIDRERVGVVCGGTGTGYAPGPDPDDHRILRNMASAPAAWISLREKLLGPSLVVSTACSSGAYALHAAHGLIARGECDLVVAGAADSSVNFLDVRGFGALLALAEDGDDPASASRPFDRRRSGFVLGEGGGMLVLEAEESARRRGARMYAMLHSPGLSSEGYNILSPEPDGRGMARTIRRALERAGLAPEAIDYVNAHGTSTPLNDRYETQALKDVFGAHAAALAVSSTKGATGHCLSAAAGVEAVIAVKALALQIVPPTLNLTDPDPELDLDYVPQGPRPRALRHVLSSSFAFGGQNGVCIFSAIP